MPQRSAPIAVALFGIAVMAVVGYFFFGKPTPPAGPAPSTPPAVQPSADKAP